MERMILIPVERVAIFEFGVEHDIVGLCVVADIDADFNRQHAGDMPAQGLQRALHRTRMRRLLRRILDLPENDVLDHGENCASVNSNYRMLEFRPFANFRRALHCTAFDPC